MDSEKRSRIKLAHLERADRCAEDLDVESFEDAHLVEGDANVESGLAAKGEEDAVWSFSLEDVGDVFGGDGEVVDLVGEVVRGLNGGDIGLCGLVKAYPTPPANERTLMRMVSILDSRRALMACEPE